MTFSPAVKTELSKWAHGLLVAVASGLYDGLSQGQAVGHIALKSVVLAIVVRFSGFAMSKVGSA